MGQIVVISGPMFAGKTQRLLAMIRDLTASGSEVHVFTHVLDCRNPNGLSTHDGARYPAERVDGVAELVEATRFRASVSAFAIDEAHFFGPELLDAVLELAARVKLVLVAGLSVTFEGSSFEGVSSLMAHAEIVVKVTATCAVCGANAAYHARKTVTRISPKVISPVHVGDGGTYEPLCRTHFGDESVRTRSL